MKTIIMRAFFTILTLTCFSYPSISYSEDYINQWGTVGTGNGQFMFPYGVAVDGLGNVYVADTWNHRIQKFDSNGTYITQWGINNVVGSLGYGSGLGILNGQFYAPSGVAVDSLGKNVYVADMKNHRIQKFNSNGAYITQWGTPGYAGHGQFMEPKGVAVDSSGNVYVVDLTNRVQKFDSNGTYITQWGTGGTGNGQFSNPNGVAVDSLGNVYVADLGNHRIQKLDSNGIYITQWGTENGKLGFSSPSGVAVDSLGNVYVANTQAHNIQKFDSNGTYITQWGTYGSGNGQFNAPRGVAVNSTLGKIYVADTGCPNCNPNPDLVNNHRIQVFSLVNDAGTTQTGKGDLVLYLPFDEGSGTSVKDQSGYGNNGAIKGKVEWSQGKKGNALSFSKDWKGYVEVADSNSLDVTKQITMTAWIKPSKLYIGGDHMQRNSIIDKYDAYYMDMGNAKLSFFLYGISKPDWFSGNTDMTSYMNVWFHVAVVYDGEEQSVYLMGRLDNFRSASGNISVNNNKVTIGWVDTTNRYFDGLIDEVTIWSRALTVTELADVMAGNIDKVNKQQGSTGASTQTGLNAAPSIARPGEAITVSYSDAPASDKTWIGMYRIDEPDSGTPIYYEGLGGEKNGTVKFYAPLYLKECNFRLFDGNILLAVSNKVTINGGTNQASIFAGPAIVQPGSDITVYYFGAPGNPKDWIGFFSSGDPDTKPLAQKYLEGTRDYFLTATASSQLGDFDFRMFSENGTRLAVSTKIKVSNEVIKNTTLTANPTTVAPGEAIVVSFYNAPGNFMDWVGMYRTKDPDNTDLHWFPLNSEKTGALLFTAPEEAGDYDFRMFPDGNYTPRLAVSNKVTVKTSVITPPTGEMKLTIPEVTSKPGQEVTVPININDATGIAGADIFMTYDAKLLTLKAVSTTELSMIFAGNFFANIPPKAPPGEITIRMASATGVPGGKGAFINVTFTVNASAPVNAEALLQFKSAEAYNEKAQNIAISTQDGKVKISGSTCLKGDVNGDGSIKSNDAILALRISAGLIPGTEQQICAADMNSDGKIKSNDSILILRAAAGMAASARDAISASGRMITVELGDVYGKAGKSVSLPIQVYNGDILAGGDICISYNSSVLRAVEVLSENDMYLVGNVTEPGLVRIAFAYNGKPGNNMLFNIKFDVLISKKSPIAISAAELYSYNGTPIEFLPRNNLTAFYMPHPEYSAVLQNFPNPFNPETWIPYQLNSPSEVMVQIFNVRGELVRKLNLGLKPAGVYLTRDKAIYWDGENDDGEKAANGIYYYTIKAGDFTATKKMAVIK